MRFERRCMFTIIAVLTVAVVASAKGPLTDDESACPPIRHLVVASPRAALSSVRHDDVAYVQMTGSAWNFPAHPIRIVVRQGTVVVFHESRNTEGVWYNRTFGTLSTKLVLQKLVITDDGERRWVTLGADGARGTRRGPSIGTADVKVRHQFARLGIHLLRALVVTKAQPLDPATDPPQPVGTMARAADEVYVLVTVLPWVNPDDTDNEVVPLDPDAESTEPLQNEQEIIE